MEGSRIPLPALLAGLIGSTLAKETVDQNLRTIDLSPSANGGEDVIMCYIAGPPVEVSDDPMGGLYLERDFQDQMRPADSDPQPEFLGRAQSTDPHMIRCLGHLEGLDTAMVQMLSKMAGEQRQLGVRVRAHRSASPVISWGITPDDCRLLATWFGSRQFDDPLSKTERKMIRRNPRLRELLGQ